MGGEVDDRIIDATAMRAIAGFPEPTVSVLGTVRFVRSVPGQNGWQWCSRCQGLAFSGGTASGRCPAGGIHDHSSPRTYSLRRGAGSGRGQDNWRWCGKCQGLAFNGGARPGNCPAGGVHDHAVSKNYTLWRDEPMAPGQDDWRWCSKCQGLAFNGLGTGPCPAGGVHDHTASDNYILWHHPTTDIPAKFPAHWVEVDSKLGHSTFAHEAGNTSPFKAA